MKIEKNSFGHRRGSLVSFVKYSLICFVFLLIFFFISISLINTLLNLVFGGFFLDFERLVSVSVIWGLVIGLMFWSYSVDEFYEFKYFKPCSYIRIIRLPQKKGVNDLRLSLEYCEFLFAGQKSLNPGETAFRGVASRRVFDHLRLSGFQEGGLVKFVKKPKPLSDKEKELGVVQIPLSLDHI